jgi:membrane glycosyltransferase
MMTQTASVAQILIGRDSGWKVQSRDSGGMNIADAMRFHWRHTLAGALLALLAWEASPGLLVWMAPVVAGLILSGPLSWLTAQAAGPVLSVVLSTPEDRAPASILLRALRHKALWTERFARGASVPGPEPIPHLGRAA